MEDFNLDAFDEFAREGVNDELVASNPATRKQVTMIYSLFSELDVDKTTFNIDSVSKLLEREASYLIEDLLKMKEEQDLDEEYGHDDFYDDIGEDLEF